MALRANLYSEAQIASTIITCMNKTTLLLSFLALLASLALGDNITSTKASLPSGSFACDKALFNALSNPRGRITESGVQFDLFRTLNKTDADNPKKVLQRISQYDFSQVRDYLRMLDYSYTMEQVYLKLSNENKASYDYDNNCYDICPTYTTFNDLKAPKNLAFPKPSNLNNFTCSVPDNPFCNDGQNGLDFADAKDDKLGKEFRDALQRAGIEQTIMYYTIQNGEFVHCATTERYRPVKLCEKYQQYRLAVSGYMNTSAFREEAYEAVLTSDLKQQTAINYIITKMKFGERIGAIYTDCRRHGKLPTDIKKPPII